MGKYGSLGGEAGGAMLVGVGDEGGKGGIVPRGGVGGARVGVGWQRGGRRGGWRGWCCEREWMGVKEGVPLVTEICNLLGGRECVGGWVVGGVEEIVGGVNGVVPCIEEVAFGAVTEPDCQFGVGGCVIDDE